MVRFACHSFSDSSTFINLVKHEYKELLKQSEQEHKAFEKLCRTRFNCPEDAERALAAYQKTLKVLTVHEVETISHKHFASAGRPRKDAVPETISYHVGGALAATISQRATLITKSLARQGCFILATNNLDEDDLSDTDILTEYSCPEKLLPHSEVAAMTE